MSFQPIYVNNKELGLSSSHSNLKTDYPAGASAINVYDIAQFAVNKILCIGEYGSPGAEIIKTHASTAPNGFTVTLASALKKPHTKDTPVYIYSFDQIEFSHSDTLTGVKAVLGSVVNIDPAQDTMSYEDTVNTAGFYFTRYKNSITGIFSDYSDGIPFSGLPENTVGYAIDAAMNDLQARFSEVLTFDKLLRDARMMLRLVRGKVKAWSKYQEFGVAVGNIRRGVDKIAVPAETYDKETNRSVLNVKIGADNFLSPLSRTDYLNAVGNAVQSSVGTQPIVGATSLVLADTNDLENSGSIDVFVNGTKYTVTYTGNDRPSKTLSGIPASGTGSITYAFPVASQVWQNEEEGYPEFYSVYDGYLHIWPLVSSDEDGRNVTMDIYTDIETIDSQMDVIQGAKFDMLIPYLKWKIRAVTENNGKEDPKDPSLAEFRELLKDAIFVDGGGQQTHFRPRGRVVNNQVRDKVNSHYLN